MKTYISKKPPTSFGDSMSIARISYKMALSMLEVRENGLDKLVSEEKMFELQKRQKDEN